MQNVFIIHGVSGSPDENWFPWLKSELEKLECNVIIPQFPTPGDHSLKAWMKVLYDYEDFINENTIFVGHSLGVAFILHVLEKHKAKAAFFVEGFIGKQDNKYGQYTKFMADQVFYWKIIKNNCNKFYIFQSDNDVFVPIEKGQELQNNLNGEYFLIKNGGHLNEEAGYKEFELLLENIKKNCK